MIAHLRPISTVEGLDAEPEGSVVALFPSAEIPVLLNTGQGRWLELDPYDRTDGEETTSSFSLVNHRAAPRGRIVIKLWEPGQTGHGVIADADALEALPDGSLILIEQGESWPKVWRRMGTAWLELDPGDMSDGGTTLSSHLVARIADTDRILHVWSPKEVRKLKVVIEDPAEFARIKASSLKLDTAVTGPGTMTQAGVNALVEITESQHGEADRPEAPSGTGEPRG